MGSGQTLSNWFWLECIFKKKGLDIFLPFLFCNVIFFSSLVLRKYYFQFLAAAFKSFPGWLCHFSKLIKRKGNYCVKGKQAGLEEENDDEEPTTTNNDAFQPGNFGFLFLLYLKQN